jgi:transmembrane 9 superfamily protein 2/4
MHAHRGVAVALYVGYMLIVSYSFFLITGSVGFLATFWFVRTIYGAIKID